jgi:hypothetical protein
MMGLQLNLQAEGKSMIIIGLYTKRANREKGEFLTPPFEAGTDEEP